MANHVKNVREKLKKPFQSKSRTILVDLGRKFQNTRCGDSDDVCAHFKKLGVIYPGENCQR
jgi:hypothetical protein